MVRVIGYASRTGTRRNLAALRGRDWRLLVSARGVLRHEGFRYALDNGAWTAFQRREPFDERAFQVAVDRLGADADWVVVPDRVGDASETLRMADRWIPRLSGLRLLLAVQDGMDERSAHLSDVLGVFVGGSTTWKLEKMRYWGEWANARGAWCHVARVNSARRISRCAEAGAHSFDGSGVSRFSCRVEAISNAAAQEAFRW